MNTTKPTLPESTTFHHASLWVAPGLPQRRPARGRHHLIEAGRDCTNVVTPLAAASLAPARAGFKIVAGGTRQYLTESEEVSPAMSEQELGKLFLALA